MEHIYEEAQLILDCIPFFKFSAIIQELKKHVNKDRATRQLLALNELFRALDQSDNSKKQEADVADIQKLLPSVSKDSISQKIIEIGNLPQRKSFVAKVLVKTNDIRKRHIGLHCSEESPLKVLRIGNGYDGNKPSTSQNVNFNNENNNIIGNKPSTSQNVYYSNENNNTISNKPSTSQNVNVDIENNNTINGDFNLLRRLDKPAQEFGSKGSESSEEDFLEKLDKRLKVLKPNEPIPLSEEESEMSTDRSSPSSVISLEPSITIKISIGDDDSDYEDTKSHQSVALVSPCTSKVGTSLSHKPIYAKPGPSNVKFEINHNENRREAGTDEENNEITIDVQPQHLDKQLYKSLSEMFPEVSSTYIKKLCVGKMYSYPVIEDIINTIFNDENVPKRREQQPKDEDIPKRKREQSPDTELNPEEQLEIVKQILPDADPSYLQMNVDRLINSPNQLKQFIADALEKKNYPTMKEYIRKQQLSAQMLQYTTDFSVKKFLEIIPDPEEYFLGKNRKSFPDTTERYSYHYALNFLINRFRHVSVVYIGRTYINRRSLSETFTVLEQLRPGDSGTIKSKRSGVKLIPDAIQNIPLLQEIAFLEHRKEIADYIEKEKLNLALEKQKAKELNMLVTCNCCFDDEVMPKDCFCCEKGCEFCRDCIQKSVEIAFGEGKLEFKCLADCSAVFDLYILQNVLKPKLFSKLISKRQMQEVKSAGIENLECCPFCDFAAIPNPEDKLFHCLNEECMKETCRLCKEPSHIPLRCDEVEKDDDVKKRTYIENKMTEALLRKCHICGLKFIKSDGCNYMTCSCGAHMCYVCGQAIRDHSHFSSAKKKTSCPLYSDLRVLHRDNVLQGAETAKQEVGVANTKELKIDPTADVEKHFKKPIVPTQYNQSDAERVRQMIEVRQMVNAARSHHRRRLQLPYANGNPNN